VRKIGRKNTMDLDEVEKTSDIPIPEDPLERVIGQDYAVRIAKICIKQRRHLLLVGPPGTGKSMIAKGIAFHLPKPKEQINVLHNQINPERPIIEIERSSEQKENQKKEKIVSPSSIPFFVAERIGLRCFNCGALSESEQKICPRCGANKNSFREKHFEIFEIKSSPKKEVVVKNKNSVLVYRKIDNNKIEILTKEINKKSKQKKTIIPFNRNPFVYASGASETELLGDVQHDPYGGHPEIGTPAYLRVIPGAIHYAHEGVLFIDELSNLGNLQSYLLTAMQEKKFPIVGRNPGSSGASVTVENVPCDFIFVGACNIENIVEIYPSLRSRINGNGYEILMNTVMEDNENNRFKLAQFIAQEIAADKKIPAAGRSAIEAIIDISRKKAKVDGKGLTLRLRDIGGIVRLAGDLAVSEECELIEEKHVKEAIIFAESVEKQLKDRYGTLWKGSRKDKVLDDKVEGGYV